jgi:hypothetical protein
MAAWRAMPLAMAASSRIMRFEWVDGGPLSRLRAPEQALSCRGRTGSETSSPHGGDCPPIGVSGLKR